MKPVLSGLMALLVAATFGSASRGQVRGAQAGTGTAAGTRPTPAAPSPLPDWAGAWTPRPGPPGEPPPLTPRYAAILKAWEDAAAHGDEQSVSGANCVPPGMPTIMSTPGGYPIEFLFTPGRVTIIQEAYMQVRRVFTDGRGHPAELDPTYNGHSIGRWEGDTLAIDTSGLRGDTVLGRPQGVKHSSKLHIVERIRLTAPDTLEDQMTIDDAEALIKPWRVVTMYTRHRDWDLMEFICQENNRNPTDEKGRATIILR